MYTYHKKSVKPNKCLSMYDANVPCFNVLLNKLTEALVHYCVLPR